jgi:hypothetical protein
LVWGCLCGRGGLSGLSTGWCSVGAAWCCANLPCAAHRASAGGPPDAPPKEARWIPPAPLHPPPRHPAPLHLAPWQYPPPPLGLPSAPASARTVPAPLKLTHPAALLSLAGLGARLGGGGRGGRFGQRW